MGSVCVHRRLRSIYRLVRHVSDAGQHPREWTDRLMRGLAMLFDAKMVALAWAELPARPGDFNRGEIQLHHGFTPEENREWAACYCGPDARFRSEYLRRVVNIPARFVTVRRQDVMPDHEWYALTEVQSTHRACDIDANMASFFVAISMGRLFGIGVHRRWGQPQFTIEERRQLRLLHVELARAWRDRIADPTDSDPAIRQLPPRLREVLWLLCLGRSEKEISHSLVLSPHTVHNHVRRLHAELGVHSRGELLARSFSMRETTPQLSFPNADMNDFKLA